MIFGSNTDRPRNHRQLFSSLSVYRSPQIPLTDDRYRNLPDYWRFLTEAWAGLRDLLAEDARLIVRIGGRRLDRSSARSELERSLAEGLGAKLRLVESGESRIEGKQLRAFRPGAEGCQVEFDYHFALS
jgi:hypothetical protein